MKTVIIATSTTSLSEIRYKFRGQISNLTYFVEILHNKLYNDSKVGITQYTTCTTNGELRAHSPPHLYCLWDRGSYPGRKRRLQFRG